MPIVKIDWFEGRSREQKEKVAEAIEKIMQEIAGCPPGSTYLVFNDIKKENWGISGKLQG